MQQKNNHLLNLACHFKKQICSTQWKTSNIVKVTKLNYHWKKPPKWTKYNLQLKWIPYNTIYIYWYIYHILYIHVVRIHHFIFVNTTFWSLLQFQFHQIRHEKGPRNPLKTLEITVSSCSNVVEWNFIFSFSRSPATQEIVQEKPLKIRQPWDPSTNLEVGGFQLYCSNIFCRDSSSGPKGGPIWLF